MSIFRYLFQGVFWALFLSVVYYFSVAPPYNYLSPDQAEIKLAFKHAGQPVEPCVKRTRAELMKLPPNMRRTQKCTRERSPLEMEIIINGEMFAKKTAQPGGVHQDMAVYVYEKFPVPSGELDLIFRMSDSVREEGYNFVKQEKVNITPGRALVIGFDEEANHVTFK